MKHTPWENEQYRINYYEYNENGRHGVMYEPNFRLYLKVTGKRIGIYDTLHAAIAKAREV